MVARLPPTISIGSGAAWPARCERPEGREGARITIRMRLAELIGAITILLTSCSIATIGAGGASNAQTATAPPSAPASALRSSSGPGQTGTADIEPAATSTSIDAPASLTSEMSPTPPSGTAPVGFSCRVLSQSMRNGAHFGPKERFEMAWKVRNNGGAAWDPSTVHFAYFSGTKMYQADHYDLPEAVNRGHTVALGASMVAPRNEGSYTTVWSLRSGSESFCHLSLRIIVP